MLMLLLLLLSEGGDSHASVKLNIHNWATITLRFRDFSAKNGGGNGATQQRHGFALLQYNQFVFFG